jgi:hypothetical protein
MLSLSVVRYFNVVEYVLLGFQAGLVISLVHPFPFKGSKEAFHNGVIITIALSAHRAVPTSICKQMLIRVASVLVTPVRVVEQPFTRLSLHQSHLQSTIYQTSSHCGLHRPTYYPPRKQI